MSARADSWPAFAGWCVAGAGASLGVLSLLTIGPFVLLLTLVLCGFLLWALEFGAGMAGLLAGAAVPVLYVAWLNRDGPGTVCTTTATSHSCGDESSPWPLLVVAALLVVGGVVLFARLRRS
jgi:hypothetical protein